jgi:(S)-2-hydroxyglutarate dehydrogenase
MSIVDIAVIGGGIVGLATALALSEQRPRSIVVLEAENEIATHQTGHNSGVIHSGLYYKPGSLKATLCMEGRELLYAFCEQHEIAYDRCGKLVVANTEDELPRLDALAARGLANGLQLRRLNRSEIQQYEPHATGAAGLWVPETGIVDYRQVAAAYRRLLQARGVEVRTGWRLAGCRRHPDRLVLEPVREGSKQEEVACRNLITCAGLQADRVAQICGVKPNMRIIPFRGEYYELTPERRHLVRNLIYPVPDPQFPFLGVHFTRKIDGGVEAGPNAVLAMRREGYGKFSFHPRDAWEIAANRGFWSLARRYWRVGSGEYYRSYSKYAFWRALHRLVPEIEVDDLLPTGAGVRAQAMMPDGKLADDFLFAPAYRMLHVLNAPSPAATASLAIGRHIAAHAAEHFE